MHLDAPVTVTVLRKRKGSRRQAFCMSFYVSGNTIYVVQLQGVQGQDVPVELRSWPAFFVASLQQLACNEKFKEIRIAKARTLGSYRYPDAKGTAREAIEQVVARIHKNMQSHYDGTARTLGFTERRRWWVWRTPDKVAPMKIGIAGDGASGLLSGVPPGCSGMGDRHLRGPNTDTARKLRDPPDAAEAAGAEAAAARQA